MSKGVRLLHPFRQQNLLHLGIAWYFGDAFCNISPHHCVGSCFSLCTRRHLVTQHSSLHHLSHLTYHTSLITAPLITSHSSQYSLLSHHAGRAAGAVHRASWRSWCARGRPWAVAGGAVHREFWSCCARGRRWNAAGFCVARGLSWARYSGPALTPSLTHHFGAHHLSHTIFDIPPFTHHLSHATVSPTIFDTQSYTPSLTHHLSHTTLSHTTFHTQHCHTQQCHTPFTHHLSHTTLSHTTFHTPSLSHHFVTYHLSHIIFHTTLSHTIFHTPSLTHHLLHTIFDTLHLSHRHRPSFTHHFVTHHL